MNTYRTVDLARMFGVHVNTVRLCSLCSGRCAPGSLTVE